MTLIVAVGCTDGVVLASDSATTDTETGTKQPSQKIRQVRQLPILWGGSGDVGLLQKIEESLTGADLAMHSVKRVRQDLKKLTASELAESRQFHVPYPQPPFHQPPVAVLLFAFILQGRGWILEIERDGRDTMYDEGLGSFAAIGSGKPWAQAAFRPHLGSQRALDEGKLLAYKVVDDSIMLAAGGLAHPIHMYTISLDGIVAEVEHPELKALADACELVREAERSALKSGLTPQPEVMESPVVIPVPDEDAEGKGQAPG